MEKYQVVIIGAGPAGAACAKALHDAGIQALIIEKEVLPRHKNCSGVLFGEAQELLVKYFGAMPPEDIYCEPKTIHASQIIEWKHAQGFVQYVWEIPRDGHEFPQTYLNVWRSTFDHWLVKQSGAQVRQKCQFRGYAEEQEQIRVDLFMRDPKLLEPGGKGDLNPALQCDYLVGADGSASSVRRALAPDEWAAAPGVVYYQEYCPFTDMGDLHDGCWHVFFEKSISKLLCCVHRKNNFLVPCVGGFVGDDVRATMEVFKTFLRENFNVVLESHERMEGCGIKMWPPDLGRGRVLLVGDAGGFMYLNDASIHAAMDSGYRCGAAIARALRDGGDALNYYRESMDDVVRHVQICSEQMHFFVE
jgi:menaquinone-9 beta-reductase